MEFISDELLNYCEQHSESENELLFQLNRQSHLRTTQPRMVSGHLQGRFLSLISRLLKPETILEIGTFTGYSALSLAEGLRSTGKLITIDTNKETNALALEFFEKSDFSKQIELKEGKALDVIPTLNVVFDMVFIDADKRNYANYYHSIIDKVRPGGIIIADNVLWSGKVLMVENEMDEDTKLIHAFNKMIRADERVQELLLPIRDGLMLIQKK
jgi:caffeoyl-CoA O-methyltransferase